MTQGTRVAHIKNSEIKRLAVPSFLDAIEIDEGSVELSDFLTDVTLPFPAADRYEYWVLHDLEHADRLRLELAARSQAMEVERFYPLYPDVADHKLMAAIRVEARLRRVAQDTPS